MIIDIITLFPGIFRGFVSETLIKRVQEKNIARINLVNLRDYATDKHRTCDDAPYGGGAGMVLKGEPIYRAVKAKKTAKSTVILLSPRGKKFTQAYAGKLARKKHLIFICGRYEGVDERVRRLVVDEEISVGDFVVSGGEVPAMLIIESVVRLLKGAISKEESYMFDSFYQGLLDWPQYTRPPQIYGLKVPDVLLSGDHRRIHEWRKKQAETVTKKRRPDLWEKYKKGSSEQ